MPLSPRAARHRALEAAHGRGIVHWDLKPENVKLTPRADPRADLWAFGCIAFELLTGARPFAGDSVADVLAAVLEREPDWSRLPESTPPSLRRLVRRCLTKDPRRRLQHAGDARLEIEEAKAELAGEGEAVIAGSKRSASSRGLLGGGGPPRRRRPRRRGGLARTFRDGARAGPPSRRSSHRMVAGWRSSPAVC